VSGQATVDEAVAALTLADVLLVACDFDGTLAPIVTHSWEAAAPPDALDALDRLGRLPRTFVAVVTGRSLASLAALGPLPSSVIRIGSHGAEWGNGLQTPLSADQADVLAKARARAEAVVAEAPWSVLEEKPAGFAVHVRSMTDRALAADVPFRLESALDGLPGLSIMHGKQVTEATVVHTSKGIALDRLRDELGASVVVYAGDDVTDETAFRVLRPGDVGIKVGDGPTAAGLRVTGVEDVTTFLLALAAARSQRP
jgi:trehalose 6-phosphate phosphatase